MNATPNLPPMPEPFLLVADQPWGGHAEVIRSARGQDGVIDCYKSEQIKAYALAAYQAGMKVSTIESVPVLAAAMALLVAGGFVTEAKVDEAIQIALHSHGKKEISADDALRPDTKGGV